MKSSYTYRELSEMQKINLAKLKRWGREFLPPDASSGQQQGIARTLSADESFHLYLAGFLVSHTKFSIPEAKIIIEDIKDFLFMRGILPSRIAHYKKSNVKAWLLIVMPYPAVMDFDYRARGIIERNLDSYSETLQDQMGRKKQVGGRRVTEQYIDHPILGWAGEASPGRENNKGPQLVDITNVKVVNVTDLLDRFLKNMGVDLFDGERPPKEARYWL